MKPHVVTAENAPKIWSWLRERGGLAIWQSVNLSDPGKSWTTPALQLDGSPTPKPTWEAENTPSRIITDPAEVLVSKDREVKRFHVAVRLGRQGLNFKCTDASTRKIRDAVAKAGNGAYNEFDYYTQEAVIMAPESQVPIAQYMAEAES